MPAWLTTQLAPVQLTLDYRFAAGRDSALERLLRRSPRIKVVSIEHMKAPLRFSGPNELDTPLRARTTADEV